MNRYQLITDDGVHEVEGIDWTVGEGMLVVRDVAGRAVVAVPVARVVRVECEYDESDPLYVARAALAQAQRDAETASTQSQILSAAAGNGLR